MTANFYRRVYAPSPITGKLKLLRRPEYPPGAPMAFKLCFPLKAIICYRRG
jgi:hypothetical protein